MTQQEIHEMNEVAFALHYRFRHCVARWIREMFATDVDY